ncbi:MAG: hypothetical protein KAS78_05325, partial [Candidatus Pacebacteria bacterium]|nr:hypothetical protein [Candidatus Paceibacterota bacterium]
MEFFFKSFGLSYASLITLFLISILSAFWITKYKFLPIVLITLFTVGSVLFLITLDENWFQQLYIMISSFIFTFALIGLYRFFIQQEKWFKKEEIKLKAIDSGFNLNQAIILISVFLISSGIYNLYIDFDLPLWVVILIIFITIFFSTIYLTKINFLKSKAHELYLDSIKNKTFSFYSFLFGLIVVELIWAISFWPANHLTVGAIVLSIYYFCWNILKNYLRNKLSKKNVILNSIFFIAFFCITLLTGNWKIS